MTKLLCERLSFDTAKVIVEAAEVTDATGQKKKQFYMDGIFIEGDVENANGRIYPRNEISQAVRQLQEKISKGESVLGELDHPETLSINLDRVSHVIEKIDLNGANGMGRLRILSEQPCGRIVENFLREGIKLGVSSRGSGEVEDYSGRVNHFEIITVDIVAQPSAPNAYPTTLYESLMGTKKGRDVYNIFEAICKGNDKIAQKYAEREIKAFIQSLKLV